MRYFVSFLIVIGLIILVFVLILKGFSGGGSTGVTTPPLIDYASTSAVVEMTIDGPVSADQTHQSLQIIVGQNQSQLIVYQGYQGNVVNSKSYTNNQAAYAVFLRSLDLAGFTKGDSSAALSDDRGYCPEGVTYVFELSNNGKDVERYWTTSCGGTHTFDGDTGLIQGLFQAQIPDYSTLSSGVNI